MKDEATSILRVENLSYLYGKLEVWKNINFRLEAGEIAFLVGQNGSGKSTLLRCLAGLAYPKTGTIYLSGVPFPRGGREQRSKLSFVSDTPSFYDDMTAEEHLQFVLRANRKDHEYPRVERLLEAFGLLRSVKQYPSSFSRGMREKLALIIAFAVKPHLLLLDEPYGPLDAQASRVLSSEIKDCISQGSSVILSCHHDVPDLMPDKVLLLDEEQLREESASVLHEMWGTGSLLPKDPNVFLED